MVDSEPTCEAELTGRLPAAARRRRSGCRPRESGRRAPGVGQPGASVGLDPAGVGLSRRHLPHLPAAPHRPRRPRRARLAQSARQRTSWRPSSSHQPECSSPAVPGAASRRSPRRCCGRHRRRRSPGSCRRCASSTRRICPVVAGRPRPAATRSARWCGARSQFAPQLLVVGETLGEEAFELLKAGNAGCGFLTTLHANSAQLGMQSLVTAALDGWREHPRARRASHVRPADRPRDPLRGRAAAPRRRPAVADVARSWRSPRCPPQISNDEFVLEPLFVREDFGRPLEFVGHHLPDDLERRLDRALPPGVTMRDLADGSAVIL